MSETENDPASVPMLFPDPVIEFYMQKIDRAALRQHLKKTPEERLEWIKTSRPDNESQGDFAREEATPWPAKKKTIDMGADPDWFAEAKAVPLLFPDPVIEAYLEDVDRGLIRQARGSAYPSASRDFNGSCSAPSNCDAPALKKISLTKIMPPEETDFSLVLRTLTAGRIDFIAVGAIAATAHGVILATEDVDVVYARR